ncbi:GldM family protein [Flavobacterium caeni]|uniref:GldM C-terminal domain-containing protein n=1 Tax=Flavobacterium caeni TaxID=490189 RepID=A0A1G5K2X1_9FLAO|nr:GldM family protein [Flavobacterium caeni]SCY94995.1 GldM C-terminal domain-containing protein [Flavobacterium caeni]
MRNISLIIFFFICSLCSAQEFYLTSEINHTIIKSIPNPIIFSFPGKECNDFNLSTDNGKIEKSNSNCKYLIYPDSIGFAKVIVKNKNGKKIGEKNFQVRNVDFRVIVPGIEDYNIKDVNLFGHTARLQITSDDLACISISWKLECELMIVENDRNIHFKIRSENGILNPEIKDQFALLKNGNLVLFNDIKLIIDNKIFKAPGIMLKVQ